MDRDRNSGRNLWEERGHKGGLLESENRRRSSAGRRQGKSRLAGEENQSTSRYGREEARSASRYGREEARSASRYGREEAQIGSRYSREEARSASRYGREEVRSASRYGRESVPEKSRYDRKEKNSAQNGSKNRSAEIAAAASAGKRGGKKRSSGLDPVKIAFQALGAVLILAYVVVAVYFGGHFYSGSQIYGIDCSKKTAAQVKEEVRDKIGEYTLTVELRNGKKDVITAAQVDLQYHDESGIEKQLKRQHCYIWPAMMLLGRSNDLVIDTNYDTENMDAVLKQMSCFLPGNVVAPQDAYRGDTEDGYEVVPEVMGTTLDYEKTKAVIMEALDQGAVSVSLDEKGCYIDPEIYRDDPELNAQVEELNALMTARITYDFDDRQEVVNPSVMKEWICQDENGTYYIDDNQIWAYVENLARKYDTFGRERIFYTSIGTAVTLDGGDYGWVIDQNATAEILRDAVKEGKTETLEPVYIYTAKDRKENDIGGTYVEICLSLQEMWCYENGYLIVDTPVVTGNPNKDNATPSGSVWAIDAKMRDYVLRGEGYEAPVDYWMPFEGDVGIHDMQNRAYFGGSIYLSNGSHGCVNTPYEAAKTIYNTVSIGTPVIVYE